MITRELTGLPTAAHLVKADVIIRKTTRIWSIIFKTFILDRKQIQGSDYFCDNIFSLVQAKLLQNLDFCWLQNLFDLNRLRKLISKVTMVSVSSNNRLVIKIILMVSLFQASYICCTRQAMFQQFPVISWGPCLRPVNI